MCSGRYKSGCLAFLIDLRGTEALYSDAIDALGVDRAETSEQLG